MRSPVRPLLLLLGLLGLAALVALLRWLIPAPPPRLELVSPRLISNQTSYPVTLYGEHFSPGSRLVIVGEPGPPLPTSFIDSRHLGARLPAGLERGKDQTLASFELRLLAPSGEKVPGQASLTVVNDTAYVLPYALETDRSGQRVFVASPTTDTVIAADLGVSPGEAIAVGDGPQALARYVESSGAEWLVVVHDPGRELRLVPLHELGAAQRHIPLPGPAQGLVVDQQGGLAYVSDHLNDAVHVVDLVKHALLKSIPVGVNPRPLALDGPAKTLVVGNLGSNDLSLVDTASGQERRAQPGAKTSILGGHTEPFASQIMGGKAARSLVVSQVLGVAFVASIGPNIGPNPKRMEVSMNGGVGVVDLASGRFLRHVSMLTGVPNRMALDESRGLLYITDVATGQLICFDANLLATSDAHARKSLLGRTELMPAEDLALIRPRQDFGVKGRSSVALHSGPWDLRISPDGSMVLVLNRFSGHITEIDVRGAPAGQLIVSRSWPLIPRTTQPQRWLGEVLYYTDLGGSRMSCDACHMDGHNEGLLFTKGDPMHIYRSPSLRSIRETAPYFTPALFPSLAFTAKTLLGRNRFHNPDPSPQEIRALAIYQSTLVTPPNPYRNLDGSLPDRIELPDGSQGDPALGLGLFETEADCSSCHPAPQFTTDQDPNSRGKLHHVGTPITLPLRIELQDAQPYPLPPPALVGVWDNFPLLHSGAAGFSLGEDGQLRATHPFALRQALESSGEPTHGNTAGLSAQQHNDLLAYLLTL